MAASVSSRKDILVWFTFPSTQNLPVEVLETVILRALCLFSCGRLWSQEGVSVLFPVLPLRGSFTLQSNVLDFGISSRPIASLQLFQLLHPPHDFFNKSCEFFCFLIYLHSYYCERDDTSLFTQETVLTSPWHRPLFPSLINNWGCLGSFVKPRKQPENGWVELGSFTSSCRLGMTC